MLILFCKVRKSYPYESIYKLPLKHRKFQFNNTIRVERDFINPKKTVCDE